MPDGYSPFLRIPPFPGHKGGALTRTGHSNINVQEIAAAIIAERVAVVEAVHDQEDPAARLRHGEDVLLVRVVLVERVVRGIRLQARGEAEWRDKIRGQRAQTAGSRVRDRGRTRGRESQAN